VNDVENGGLLLSPESFNLVICAPMHVEIKITAALTREIAEDPGKRAGDSFENYKVIYISCQEPM
jgi:hypothetical protein